MPSTSATTLSPTTTTTLPGLQPTAAASTIGFAAVALDDSALQVPHRLGLAWPDFYADGGADPSWFAVELYHYVCQVAVARGYTEITSHMSDDPNFIASPQDAMQLLGNLSALEDARIADPQERTLHRI